MCRRGGSDFEICVMNADGSGQVQITDNGVLDATPTWSPDGNQIVFHRPVGGLFQLWSMNPDGTGQTQLTTTPGLNLFPNWGELRVIEPKTALRVGP
jgi:TolB protein